MACTRMKRCFTEQQADNALEKAALEGSKQYRAECRKYYCHECAAWHLTSEPDKNIKPRKVKLKFKNKFKQFISG